MLPTVQNQLYQMTVKSLEEAIVGILRDKVLEMDQMEKLDHAYNTIVQKNHYN